MTELPKYSKTCIFKPSITADAKLQARFPFTVQYFRDLRGKVAPFVQTTAEVAACPLMLSGEERRTAW